MTSRHAAFVMSAVGAALLAACGSGVGPIGTGPSGQWEPPSGQSGSGQGSNPAQFVPKGSDNGGSSSSGGGTLVTTCSGTYACVLDNSGTQVYQATFQQQGSQCTVSAEGETGNVNADGTVTSGGVIVLVWTGDASRYLACPLGEDGGMDTTSCVTCTPGSGSASGPGGDAGVTD
jgi:hypothetical protein